MKWKLYASELIGTALLLAGGLSIIIALEGTGSPLAHCIANDGLRRLVVGFLFGGWASLIVVSPVGKVSGAHINPAVTLGFLLMGKMRFSMAIGYVLAQLIGAFLGSTVLLAWGSVGRSIAFGATLPGVGYSLHTVFWGEASTTFALIVLLCVFLGFRHLRPFLPLAVPFLYAVMVYLEAPISGTSTNPARSFGPAIISGAWQGGWIYWAGPAVGAILGTAACSWFAKRITSAKLYYFDTDRDFLFRRSQDTTMVQ